MQPKNVFAPQLKASNVSPTEHLNRHILFRRVFTVEPGFQNARMYLTADDYYKLYINGTFVCQGPTASYPFFYNYNTVDVTQYLQPGENTIAVHTLYQGLINRVWVSGDDRHGLLCDLEVDGTVVLSSDSGFKTAIHTAYEEQGRVGYDTQFMESYDSSAAEVGFEAPGFDDSAWPCAQLRKHTDYTLTPQTTAMLEFETVQPAQIQRSGNRMLVDFGAMYTGRVQAAAKGQRGSRIIVRCGQELNEDGSLRYQMRCNCTYEEDWILSGGADTLDWFDNKALRYVELLLPDDCTVGQISLTAQHYPFVLRGRMKPAYRENEILRRIWDLCVRTQKYGVQEVIQDCTDREKGFYVGDGCYTALTQMLLTGDDSLVRCLIDSAWRSTLLVESSLTCLNCSFMQEIAEYPLIMLSLILWHYRLTGDLTYLRQNYPHVCRLLDVYRRDYEKDGLLQDLDKWCVVEWPANFRDGYDVDITEGKVCHEPHVVMNAYYIEAVRTANTMAEILGEPAYRDESPLVQAFVQAFYEEEKHLFTDSRTSSHISYVGNVFAFAFRLCPDSDCEKEILAMIVRRGISDVSFFAAFPMLIGMIRRDLPIESLLLDEGAWQRMLREGATFTFEGWGRDTKWNTSLSHLTMSYAAVFLADTDLKKLFE